MPPNYQCDPFLHLAFAGLDEWGEDEVLHQVLAASQQEYLDSLKKKDDKSDTNESDKRKKEKE